MSEVQKRRFPYWLTLSVLCNLVLVGLIAGVLLKSPHKPDRGKPYDKPAFEMSESDREAVRQLMHESFEAGRAAMDVRREAERNLAKVLSAETYDETAARAALAELREADRQARELVSNRMFDGLEDLSQPQRALVGKIMSGNIDRRGDRRERWKERREKRREGEPEAERP